MYEIFDFHPDYTYNGYQVNGLEFILGFYMVCFLLMMIVGLGMYILQSLGMYAVAKRRCIRKPWLAWIPVGSEWILGSISDQYRYVVKRQVKNKRKALLTLGILVALLCVLVYVLFGAFLAQAIAYDGTVFVVDHSREMEMLGTFMGMVGVSLLMSGLAIAMAVVRFMALYDLYTSCESSNGVLFLVLSILIPITQPIFLFICRNKDEGMPPRRPQLFEE